MVYRCSTQNGTPPVIREYVAGGTGEAGDIVALGADDAVTVAAADATQALGWLTGAVQAGDRVNVMEANDNTLVELPFTGEFAAGMLGGFFGLTGESGAQQVKLAETTNTLFKLVKITRNGTATGHEAGDQRCLVLIPSAKSQGVVAS